MTGVPHYAHLLLAQGEGALWHPLVGLLGRDRPARPRGFPLRVDTPETLAVERRVLSTLLRAFLIECGLPGDEVHPARVFSRALARAMDINAHARWAADERRAADRIGSAGIPRWAPGATVILKPGERM